MDEEIITQMGLLLTQLRFTRRAVEDLERNTATYGGFAFLRSLTSSSRFGEPPLFNGALKVYVVNINDLTGSRGISGIFETLLGGVGRFFGGLVGGVVGGTISGIALPVMLGQLNSIAGKIQAIVDRVSPTPGERMLDRFLTFLEGRGARADAGAAASNAGTGETLTESLPRITDLILGLTQLFRAASGDPGGSRGATPASRGALQQMQRALRPIQQMLSSVSHIVDGLIILVPIITGAFAMFLSRLDAVKLAFIEMLQFVLRNVFLLRGAVLVTVFDTLSAAARLGTQILRILQEAVNTILTSVFSTIAQVLNAALSILRFVMDGAVRTINTLLPWLTRTMAALLQFLGDTRIFRLFYHLVDILPNVLPALVRLKHNVSLTSDEWRALRPALTATVPGPSRRATGALPTIPPLPDLGSTLLPTTEIGRVVSDVRTLGRDIRVNTGRAIGAAESALRRMGRSLDETGFRTELTRRLGEVRTHSGNLAAALTDAQRAAARGTRTGLDAIANAYREWLSGGGLSALLGRINDHFRRAPEVARRVVADVALERARATVEIGEVVVEIAPPEESTSASTPTPSVPALAARIAEHTRELEERGASFLTPGFVLEA